MAIKMKNVIIKKKDFNKHNLIFLNNKKIKSNLYHSYKLKIIEIC